MRRRQFLIDEESINAQEEGREQRQVCSKLEPLDENNDFILGVESQPVRHR
jgi:hypothetical protein